MSGPATEADLIHGGGLAALRARFPDAAQPWFDLSTGINPWPYGLPPIPEAVLHRLPDSDLEVSCRTAMARAFGCAAQAVLPVPGSALAIALLPRVLAGLCLAGPVAVVSPTYGDHARSWAAAGHEVLTIDDPATLPDEARCAVLTNPNNPDGHSWPPDVVLALASCLAARGGALIVDEAFADSMPDLSVSGYAGRAGLIVLRSAGKTYGLAGLRLGAVLCPPDVLAALTAAIGSWPVSGLALWAGARLYSDHSWLEATTTRLHAAARRQDAALAALGIASSGACPLFRWVRVGDAHTVWHTLAHNGIAARRFADIPTHLRIGLAVDEAALARLVSAFQT